MSNQFGHAFSIYIFFNIVEMTANMYSDIRDEARDHARLRNAYFEQVSPQVCEVVFLLNVRPFFNIFLTLCQQ